MEMNKATDKSQEVKVTKSVTIDGEMGGGGFLAFYDGAVFIKTVVLPPMEFTVLLYLAKRAQEAEDGRHNGFTSREKVLNILGRNDLADSYSNVNVVTATIHRLRSRLFKEERLQNSQFHDVHTWLIETERFLGYRFDRTNINVNIREWVDD